MSTANEVPETWELTGDDAWKVLKHTGRRRLLADAFMRMRLADGFSHARSMAFVVSLSLVQGVIAVVGLTSIVGQSRLSDVLNRTVEGVVPGPGSETLQTALSQAQRTGRSGEYLALVLGTLGWVISTTTAMGQVERGLNRMYGIEQDRPSVKKYARGLLFALTAGILTTLGFACLARGKAIGDTSETLLLDDVWAVARWPLAAIAFTVAVTMLFRWSPRRRQPSPTWLAFGSAVSVVLLFLSTILLGVLFNATTTFGTTYGPLAGMVALLLWAVLASVSLFYGGAVTAQLEAVRAGAPAVQDKEKAPDPEEDHDLDLIAR